MTIAQILSREGGGTPQNAAEWGHTLPSSVITVHRHKWPIHLEKALLTEEQLQKKPYILKLSSKSTWVALFGGEGHLCQLPFPCLGDISWLAPLLGRAWQLGSIFLISLFPASSTAEPWRYAIARQLPPWSLWCHCLPVWLPVCFSHCTLLS